MCTTHAIEIKTQTQLNLAKVDVSGARIVFKL